MAKPEKIFRLGAVSASVFRNDSQSGQFRTIQVQRRYKDEHGEWRSSDSFTAQQAALATAVLQQAAAYVVELESHRED